MKYKTSYSELHDSLYTKMRQRGADSWSTEDILNKKISEFDLLIKDFNFSIGFNILILGCGDGELALRLAKKHFNVTGFDISKVAIDWAKQKCLTNTIEMDLKVVDISTQNQDWGQFDVIYDDLCLHCIIGQDRNSVFENIAKNLKQNGYFILNTHFGDPPENLPPEVYKSWDSKQRIQFQNEYAGRYFDREEDLMNEVTAHSLKLVHLKKFQEQADWPRLLAVFTKNS